LRSETAILRITTPRALISPCRLTPRRSNRKSYTSQPPFLGRCRAQRPRSDLAPRGSVCPRFGGALLFSKRRVRYRSCSLSGCQESRPPSPVGHLASRCSIRSAFAAPETQRSGARPSLPWPNCSLRRCLQLFTFGLSPPTEHWNLFGLTLIVLAGSAVAVWWLSQLGRQTSLR
jgi:hypothetical protein